MESMVVNRHFWFGKNVFLTGHTGFKGGWLALWLSEMGAKVHGYALAPLTYPSFYEVSRLADRLASNTISDIRDGNALNSALLVAKPEVVLHLAAQPLVRNSYYAPVETYDVNVMGTVNLFEAVRKSRSIKAVVNVTTDKCYLNKERNTPYAEDEPIGGYDPYSSSKACSELVTLAYRKSFLGAYGIALASARAGNVIGGGDWSADRLLPDFFRAIDAGEVLNIRYPNAIRPWQHVLEPLSGYLNLAERLYVERDAFAEAWNFGPKETDSCSVEQLLENLRIRLPAASWQCDATSQPHEAGILLLDSSKAKKRLAWSSIWNIEEALEKVVDWHIAWKKGSCMQEFSLKQISTYEKVLNS
jgi:CDP-glucose 4,6-dehydratase